MQQSDPYYQYYQSHFQNPNPIPASNPTDPPPQLNPYGSASAPPAISNYSPSGYSDYSSPFQHHTDHGPNQQFSYQTNPYSLPSGPPPQPYGIPPSNSQPTQYYPYDQNQSLLSYDHPNPSHSSHPDSSFSSAPYSSAPSYGNSYEAGKNPGGYGDQGIYADGAYAYSGGNKEPYGARGTGSRVSSGVLFDDYGRPIGTGNEKSQSGTGLSGKVVKAAPKAEAERDAGSGVQKFRAKLLSEGPGQRDMDVLCQIGLDGIRILDPATSRTLKIYSLEMMTRMEILDSYIFAFWAKTSVDMEPKRVRLKSNSYTSSNMLDTVTAASFQLKEIGETKKSSEAVRATVQPPEKKKGFPDWMNLMKPRNEEKDYWVPDEAVTKCTACATDFNAFVRRHHCRNCGDIFCDKCTQGRIALTTDENAVAVRVCDRCMAEVTQRLANAKDTARKLPTFHSHEDLAKRLKEEMEKNRKATAGLASSGSGMMTKEVACPTCTVHLQVQVPASGSETIECSVCQHPFLVSAH